VKKGRREHAIRAAPRKPMAVRNSLPKTLAAVGLAGDASKTPMSNLQLPPISAAGSHPPGHLRVSALTHLL